MTPEFIETTRNLIIFILILGGLVFIHELGHFLAAVRVGVKIDEFGIGFPPRAVKLFEWRGTEFTLNWIPLGGFVRPAGEDDPEVEGGLAAANPWARLVVLAAGSTFNFILGYLVFTLGFSIGWPDQVVVSYVEPGTPAETAGILVDDLILFAGGQEIHSTSRLATVVNERLGEPIAITLLREGERIETTVTPRTEWPADQGPMGIQMTWEIARYPLPTALVRAGEEVAYIVTETLLLPVRLFTNQVDPSDARIVSPVGLATISDAAVSSSFENQVLFPVLQMIALISVALGLTNLLPIPALDGGRIMFVLLELVRGKPVDADRERWVHAVGMLMLLGLMFILVIQDIINPIQLGP